MLRAGAEGPRRGAAGASKAARCAGTRDGASPWGTVRGDKPDSLLDSYTSERRPVAEAVLANTLAQVALMRPDSQSIAMRDIFAKLLELDEVNGHIDGLTSGLATRYDLDSERDLIGRLTGDRSVGRADS